MKTRRILLVMGLLALAISLQMGCTTMSTVGSANSYADQAALPDKRVITDHTLNQRVQVLGVNSATGPGGLLKIQIEVKNRTSYPQSFSYRIEWFDGAGMIILLPTTTAIPKTLEGKEVASLTATAPTDRAKDFRIKFLEAVR